MGGQNRLILKPFFYSGNIFPQDAGVARNGAAMRNICVSVSYDGTRYSGFQTQPSGNTIQDRIEEAIRVLTGERVSVIGSGRTDAGVHARKQVINFHTESPIPIERWALALNARLPDDIVALEAREAPPHFHARKSAKKKTYRYTINCGRFPDVFRRKYQFHHPKPLHVDEMRAALERIVGEHDFTSFCSVHSTQPSHVRTIYEARIDREMRESVPSPSELLHIYVTGNGFLQHMVRIIVGTLIEIGEGKKSSDDMTAILEAKDRSKAGPTAMPHGLMLWDVDYGDSLP